MSLVFPYLPGMTWPVERTIGNFDTSVETALSGKLNNYVNRTQARYKYTVSFEALDASGANAGLIANSFQTLAGFFLQCYGKALMFQWWDVDDNLATTQQFGVGDGVTQSFQLARAWGGWVDNVFAPLNSLSPVLVPNGVTGGQSNAPYPAPMIYDNGVLKTAGADYAVNAANGQVTFTVAPIASHALTWTGNFYWWANFDEDMAAFSKFMAGLVEAKKIAFTTRIL